LFAITKHVIQRLEEVGALFCTHIVPPSCHILECLTSVSHKILMIVMVVRGAGSCLPMPKYTFMKLKDLQDFLSERTDLVSHFNCMLSVCHVILVGKLYRTCLSVAIHPVSISPSMYDAHRHLV
jgi:hypothetical protein